MKIWRTLNPRSPSHTSSTVSFLFVLFFLNPVNNTEIGPLQTVDISDPDVTKWTLHDLEPLTKYRFYLRSCTTVGCGPVASEESTTTLESSE